MGVPPPRASGRGMHVKPARDCRFAFGASPTRMRFSSRASSSLAKSMDLGRTGGTHTHYKLDVCVQQNHCMWTRREFVCIGAEARTARPGA